MLTHNKNTDMEYTNTITITTIYTIQLCYMHTPAPVPRARAAPGTRKLVVVGSGKRVQRKNVGVGKSIGPPQRLCSQFRTHRSPSRSIDSKLYPGSSKLRPPQGVCTCTPTTLWLWLCGRRPAASAQSSTSGSLLAFLALFLRFISSRAREKARIAVTCCFHTLMPARFS